MSTISVHFECTLFLYTNSHIKLKKIYSFKKKYACKTIPNMFVNLCYK